MRLVPMLLCGLAVLSVSGVAAANNETDDGFIWIDANTRIKVKKVSTAAGGASAAEKAPKKAEKKEKPKK
ncbi:MAG: hypothetical protein ACREUZ_18935 [Burkholderiales bacterium]